MVVDVENNFIAIGRNIVSKGINSIYWLDYPNGIKPDHNNDLNCVEDVE